MDRTDRYLKGGLVISMLLFYLSIWGLWRTDNPLYLLSLSCCLSALLFTAYHLLKLSMQLKDPLLKICVVFVQTAEPEAYPDPLYAKVKERM